LEIRCGWVGVVSVLQAEAQVVQVTSSWSFILEQCISN